MLREDVTLTAVQKSSLIQQLLYSGKPLPKELAFVPNANNPFTGPVPSGPKNAATCRCSIIQMAHSYQLTRDHISDNGSRRSIYGLYGSRGTTFNPSGGSVRVWSGWGMEGPARWNALTGQSQDGCPRAPFGATWNAEVDDNIVANFNQGYEITMPAPNIASMVFNYLCIDQDDNPLETDCECDEDKIVRFQAQYHSITKSQAEVFKGGLFCANDKNAAAEAIDFALLSVGNPLSENLNDPNNPYAIGDYQNIAVSINGSTTECGITYSRPSVVDFLELAYYAYRYIKAGDLINTGEPVADDVLRTGFEQYYSNNVFDKLSEIFDSPWQTYTGRCGGDINGRSAVFQLLDDNNNTSPTQGNAGTVNFIARFNVNQPVEVMISSGASMRVAGQRRWKADASVLSSFRLASVVLATAETNDNGDPELCCTPGMASYALSAISGDDPSSGISENTWRGLTQSFFNVWGFNDFRIRPDDQVGHYVRTSSICENTISVDDPKVLQNDPERFAKITSFQSLQDLMVDGYSSEVSIFDIAGRRVWQGNDGNLSSQGSILNLGRQLPAGIYLAVVRTTEGKVKVAKFVHQNR
ncbi:T9SS type A sorting domain-containing protein [Neolewinella lacunae]|uniref:T9SS type A sorting domain-containing protein n=1 Tax=Neolewinella lacunae TaxID=1517758 RepID=A0A923T8K2_9BACT|nr:T9SS type A sorting domain-containing protein [Neolewinella lacunae]MBC6994048.1 T9SS type A sorting domain-containing protein [Neolewinella lacunae]MDN3636082.1 T9SS type A sorting domain-containing protein [Neolewinella lacunae]